MPNIKNVRHMSGYGFFKAEGEPFHINFGYVESITRKVSTEMRPYHVSAENGISVLMDEEPESVGVSGTIVLRETSARNLALASSAKQEFYVQAAATDVTIAVNAGTAGSMIDLGYLNIASFAFDDGLGAAIDEGAYKFDAQAGILELVEDVDGVVTLSAPAIVDTDRKTLINVLSSPGGIRGSLIVRQTQRRGKKRFKIVQDEILITTDADWTMVQEGTEPITLTLNWKAVNGKFGKVIEIDNDEA